MQAKRPQSRSEPREAAVPILAGGGAGAAQAGDSEQQKACGLRAVLGCLRRWRGSARSGKADDAAQSQATAKDGTVRADEKGGTSQSKIREADGVTWSQASRSAAVKDGAARPNKKGGARKSNTCEAKGEASGSAAVKDGAARPDEKGRASQSETCEADATARPQASGEASGNAAIKDGRARPVQKRKAGRGAKTCEAGGAAQPQAKGGASESATCSAKAQPSQAQAKVEPQANRDGMRRPEAKGEASGRAPRSGKKGSAQPQASGEANKGGIVSAVAERRADDAAPASDDTDAWVQVAAKPRKQPVAVARDEPAKEEAEVPHVETIYKRRMDANSLAAAAAAVVQSLQTTAPQPQAKAQAKAQANLQAKAPARGGALDLRRGPASGTGRQGGFCALFPLGDCPFRGETCPRGQHGWPPAPAASEVLVKITRAKMRLLQQKWSDAGGPGELVGAWQVRNPRQEFEFRVTECEFAKRLGRSSDAIDGWHGTAEENIYSIAVNGFDTKRRCGQVYGAGEYFAKSPSVSVHYTHGGSFMLLCKLLLGEEESDHTWVDSCKYYVLKQHCGIQALPLFVVQFNPSSGKLAGELSALKARDIEDAGLLGRRQRGGQRPCEGRWDAGMTASSTRHLWVGWLAPSLLSQDNDALAEDVEQFFHGFPVEQVLPERNGARIGAYVVLAKAIDRREFDALRARLYHGEFRISVDDQQPGNPRCRGKRCPRLTGPGHYCRGWNIRGHHAWQFGCSFAHPPEHHATYGASHSFEDVPPRTAKYDEVEGDLLRSAPFFSADGSGGYPKLVAVKRVRNTVLEGLYEERRGFLHDKHGFIVEKELWHGTNCNALPELLTHGLHPPSDTQPAAACPRSGGKGLCTTLCGTDCDFCCLPHDWSKCHMYGLGVYLADMAQKSHRYVRQPAKSVSIDSAATPARAAASHTSPPVYSMLRCRVCLGSPFLIEGNLLTPQAMHDVCWCQDPSEAIDSCVEEWGLAHGHDAYYVRGLAGAQKAGLGVYNSEYIVFQPYQILPLYRVDYVLQ